MIQYNQIFKIMERTCHRHRLDCQHEIFIAATRGLLEEIECQDPKLSLAALRHLLPTVAKFDQI